MTSWNKGIAMSEEAKRKNAETYAVKRATITYTEKVCKKCNITKPLSDFPKKKDNADGHLHACRSCDNARKKKHKPSNEKSRQYWLKYNYGIGLEEYNTLLTEQQGVCAICGSHPTKERRLAVDHCHTTGEVRGLLCFRCNATLGKFNDDITLFQKAIEYLAVKKPAEASF